jgi:hypothetical protein
MVWSPRPPAGSTARRPGMRVATTQRPTLRPTDRQLAHQGTGGQDRSGFLGRPGGHAWPRRPSAAPSMPGAVARPPPGLEGRRPPGRRGAWRPGSWRPRRPSPTTCSSGHRAPGDPHPAGPHPGRAGHAGAGGGPRRPGCPSPTCTPTPRPAARVLPAPGRVAGPPPSAGTRSVEVAHRERRAAAPEVEDATLEWWPGSTTGDCWSRSVTSGRRSSMRPDGGHRSRPGGPAAVVGRSAGGRTLTRAGLEALCDHLGAGSGVPARARLNRHVLCGQPLAAGGAGDLGVVRWPQRWWRSRIGGPSRPAAQRSPQAISANRTGTRSWPLSVNRYRWRTGCCW